MTHALILSGGGARGAFHVGVVSRLAETGINYAFISGVSAGALVGALVAQNKTLQSAADEALRIWDQDVRRNKDIYKRWFWGQWITGLWRDSFYNSKPLWKLVQKHLRPEDVLKYGRTFRMGVVGVGTGNYREVLADQVDKDELWKWVIASSAVPPYFLPISIDSDLWIDGGVRTIAPLRGAIDAGCDAIDVVITSDLHTKSADVSDSRFGTKRNTYTIALRAVGLLIDEIFERDVLNDIARAQHINARIALGDPAMAGKRHITIRLFQPNAKLHSSLDFSHALNKERIQHGREVVAQVLSSGS